jgi:uncharacterized membrane protein AbrB (regulator of aidB expression)
LGLAVGLFGGLVGGRGNIKLVESLKFSWSNLVVGLLAGLIGGLLGGLVLGLPRGPVLGLVLGLVFGLVFGLFGGLTAEQIETKTKPNQGIWLSGRNALFVGLAGLVTGLVIGLVGVPTIGLAEGLAIGLVVGLVGGHKFGGRAFIQHFVLRFIMWRNGDIPRDYAGFLDCAADERIFLRKVGGGYIFIHHMLLEYFASLETQPSAESGK